MLRLLIFFFASLLVACSKDKPAPVAPPAGKSVSTVDAPSEPTNLRVEAITDTSARVAWDQAEGATDYDVNYRTAIGGKWTNEPHRGVRLYNIIYDLEPGTEYRWAVRAENKDGPSDWVFAENFTTLNSVDTTQNTQLNGDFNIELVFVSDDFTDEDRELISETARLWEQVIVGDLPDYRFERRSYVYESTYIEEGDVIDDLRIYVDVLGDVTGIAGRAHAVLERVESGLPYVGIIWLRPRVRYNSDGNKIYRDPPDYQAIAAHEICHVLGIGGIQLWWENLQSSGAYESDPHFTGRHARQAFDESGGWAYKGAKVPVAIDKIHWDPLTLGEDVIAPAGELKISAVTVGALADLGYTIQPSPTEPVQVVSIEYGRGAGPTVSKSGSNRPFNIQFKFIRDHSQSGKAFTDREWEVIKEAGEFWEEIIIEDLPDYTVPEDFRSVGHPLKKGQNIDDLLVFVETLHPGTVADGVIGYGSGNLIDQLRPLSGLPAASVIGIIHQEDSGLDWNDWRQLAIHQICHALGFGSGNPWYSLLENDLGTPYRANWLPLEPVFTGTRATQALNQLANTSARGVPIIDEWPFDHWDPDDFPDDLMSLDTGILHTGRTNKKQWQGEITEVTIGALADLGYTVRSSSAAKPVTRNPYSWCGVQIHR